jgi:hypothetical protein
MAWKRGRIGSGNDSVEAAGMGGGLQEETGNREQPRVGGDGKHSLEVHGVAHLDGLAGGKVWAGRPVAWSGAMIQRYLEGWQLLPPGRYLWEVPPLGVLLQQPEGHGQFNPLWMVQ